LKALAKEKGIEPRRDQRHRRKLSRRRHASTTRPAKTEDRFNTETGQVDLFALKTVVEEVTTPATEISINEARDMYRPLYGERRRHSIELGDEMEFPKRPRCWAHRRADAQAGYLSEVARRARACIRRVQRADRRSGDGTVKRFENGDINLEIGRIEAVLPRKEQSRAEKLHTSTVVRTVIRASTAARKAAESLSRTDPALLIKLFEQEVRRSTTARS